MKRSTVNSSMRRTTKIITLMLIITVAVGLLPLVSTTVDAAVYDADYITYFDGVVYVSDAPLHVVSGGKSDKTYDSPYFKWLCFANASHVMELKYNTSFNQWNTSAVYSSSDNNSYTRYIYGTSTKVTYGVYIRDIENPLVEYGTLPAVVLNSSLNSYETGWFTSVSHDLTQLPQGLTEESIQDIVNEQINTQTASGQAAQTIINNTTNQYNLYLTGDISSQEMQQNVTDNINSLNDLTPSTLLDAMQINNALTYNQTIQDQLLLTASDGMLSLINTYRHATNVEVNRYKAGELDQRETVSRLRSYIRDFNNSVIENGYTSQADLQASEMCISFMQSQLDSVIGYSDLSQSSSDKSQASDQEELDYLDDLTAETTATVEQIAPSKNFTGTQTGEAQEVLDLIWENEFVKRLLPMCAGFMVVCVVLGIRYKV